MGRTIDDRVIAGLLGEALQPLLSFHPVASNLGGLRTVAESVADHLVSLGFSVRRAGIPGKPDILVAERAGAGPLRIGLSGHYDIEEAGDGWATDPFVVTEREGRLFARGIADNLGPLLLRLLALAAVDPAPSLLFVLQGEEEVGSPAAHALYPKLDVPRVDLWLEETGYYELDGTQRLLARRADRCPPQVREALDLSARHHGRAVITHDRYLNKAFGEQRCPFLTHLVGDAPYLAIGPNDPQSVIHQPNESLPISNLAASLHQFQATLAAAAAVP